MSSIFYMETTRNTFVTSLSKFTHLNNLREIRHKNIASIKTLITIAHTDGDHLQVWKLNNISNNLLLVPFVSNESIFLIFLKESWTDVLQCISKLEMMHLLGSGANVENTFQDGNPGNNFFSLLHSQCVIN